MKKKRKKEISRTDGYSNYHNSLFSLASPAENIRLRISKREFQRMAVSMPFVPEDTAKECNKKRRMQKKRERRVSAREMPERGKNTRNNTATRTR